MTTYTDTVHVSGIKATKVPMAGFGGQDAFGYGPKIPTRYMVRYSGRWRRVYVMQYANAGSAYIVVNGEDRFLDTDTEHALMGVSA